MLSDFLLKTGLIKLSPVFNLGSDIIKKFFRKIILFIFTFVFISDSFFTPEKIQAEAITVSAGLLYFLYGVGVTAVGTIVAKDAVKTYEFVNGLDYNAAYLNTVKHVKSGYEVSKADILYKIENWYNSCSVSVKENINKAYDYALECGNSFAVNAGDFARLGFNNLINIVTGSTTVVTQNLPTGVVNGNFIKTVLINTLGYSTTNADKFVNNLSAYKFFGFKYLYSVTFGSVVYSDSVISPGSRVVITKNPITFSKYGGTLVSGGFVTEASITGGYAPFISDSFVIPSGSVFNVQSDKNWSFLFSTLTGSANVPVPVESYNIYEINLDSFDSYDIYPHSVGFPAIYDTPGVYVPDISVGAVDTYFPDNVFDKDYLSDGTTYPDLPLEWNKDVVVPPPGEAGTETPEYGVSPEDFLDLQNKIRDLTEQFIDIFSKVGGLSDISGDTTTKVDDITDDLYDVRTKTDTLTDDLYDIGTKVDGLTDDLYDVKTEVGGLTGKLEDVDSRVGVISSLLDNVDSKVDSLNTAFTDAVSDLKTNIDTSLNNLGASIIGEGSLNFDKFKTYDLVNIFPFCIPFDLVNCITALSATPLAPVFTFSFSGTKMGAVSDVVFDLEKFSNLAQIIRFFIFLFFAFGLIKLTRSIVRG